MSALDELSQSLTSLAASVTPSIVGIGSRLRGSGVVVADGQVLTNAHNVRGDEVTVTFADGRSTTGRLAGIDVDGDLAVIAVDTAGAQAIAWGDGDGPRPERSSLPAPRRPAAALGSRSGPSARSSGPSAAREAGRSVAASSTPRRSRRVRPAARFSTPTGGCSGSTPTGSVRASTWRCRPTPPCGPGSRRSGRGESVARPRLGIAVAPARVSRRLRESVGLPERDGVLVRGVEDDSPAARAGIRDGDLIVEIAGQAVTEADQLQEILASSPMPFEVKVVRGTDERTVSVGGEADAAGEA